MPAFLREPLVHFLLLGGLLFVLYGALNRDALRAPDEIVVDQARVDALQEVFERTWQRPPNAVELRNLVDGWVREEILYREGVAAGLDEDDTVVRRRVVQKMQFMSEGMAAAAAPSDAELEAWLQAHADAYRMPPRYTLQQVFFEPRGDVKARRARIAAGLAALREGRADGVGDTTLLPGRLEDASANEYARIFGEAFVEGLATLPEGRWSGPVESGYGQHLVRIESRTPGRMPDLAEVRAQVERDLTRARGDEVAESLYQGLRTRYKVVFDDGVALPAPAATDASPAGDSARAPSGTAGP
ncbi:peptidyl-prolyl cis-trans isomerase [Marilutibacter aestuarii]|uniref:peptidylprolyl isomerase n=1 Tax=Marilutibacter aestuarii TaxID=1706195 RepID=A0A508AS54_9GAMM|nr:peptidylprolyl isomerase [Lysobacter aestuarii]TQD51304.1 peptidyl-prolyl cis-trans isomerase [Lysobacter aestuarii]